MFYIYKYEDLLKVDASIKVSYLDEIKKTFISFYDSLGVKQCVETFNLN